MPIQPEYLEAMQLGVQDYLEKPLHPAEVATIVASYLKGSVGQGQKQQTG
jgi:YesN/AraC family two-component response regulator